MVVIGTVVGYDLTNLSLLIDNLTLRHDNVGGWDIGHGGCYTRYRRMSCRSQSLHVVTLVIDHDLLVARSFNHSIVGRQFSEIDEIKSAICRLWLIESLLPLSYSGDIFHLTFYLIFSELLNIRVVLDAGAVITVIG